MTIGETLRKLRISRNLTQKEFAKIFHISESVISLYEGNKRNPNYDILLQFSDFFGVSTDYLLGNDAFLVGNPSLGGSEALKEELKKSDKTNAEERQTIARAVMNQSLLSDEQIQAVKETILRML